jgi:hypothetical protein
MFFARRSEFGMLRFLGSQWMGAIVLLFWWLMLVRVVQEDSPAGDKQFWVTKPYRWPSLLGAKVAFLLVFINLPLLVGQLVLLEAAGFSPWHCFSRILWLHLTLACFLVPVAALAAVAGDRTQLSRIAIVALIFVAAWSLLNSRSTVFYYTAAKTTPIGWIERALLIAVPIVVVLRQYSVRKTAQARWLLLGTALALTALSIAEPKQHFNESRYPLRATGDRNDLSLMMEKPPTPASAPPYAGDSDHVYLPVRFSVQGVPVGQVVQMVAARTTLRAPDGTVWSSDWQSLFGVIEHQQDEGAEAPREAWRVLNTRLEVDKPFFDRFKDVPVKINVEAAGILMRDHQSMLSVINGQLELPGIGKCLIGPRHVWCRTAFSSVPMLGVTVTTFTMCTAGTGGAASLVSSTGWVIRGVDGDFGLSAVHTFAPFFYREQGRAEFLCPQSTFALHLPDTPRNFRIEQDMNEIRQADYTQPPFN